MKKMMLVSFVLVGGMIGFSAAARVSTHRIPQNEHWLAGQCKANEVVFMGLCVDRKDSTRR